VRHGRIVRSGFVGGGERGFVRLGGGLGGQEGFLRGGCVCLLGVKCHAIGGAPRKLGIKE
jgi:hypothetical protein